MKKYFFWFLIFMNLNSLILIAQQGTAGLAGEFLRWGTGARAVGMGHANVAVATDATANYWNPAGLVETSVYGFSFNRLERIQKSFKFSASHQRLLESVAFWDLNFSTSFCRFGTFGLGLLMLGTDDIQGWEWDAQGFPTPTDQYAFHHYAGLISWGGRLCFWPTIDFGLTAKLLWNNVTYAGNQFQGGGLDAGMRLQLPEIGNFDLTSLYFGFKCENLLELYRHFRIGNELYPAGLVAGIAWYPGKLWRINSLKNFRPVLAIDYEYMESRLKDNHQWRGGLEVDYVWNNLHFFSRLGLKSNRLCVGLGFSWSGFSIDGSFKDYSDINLNRTLQFSISYYDDYIRSNKQFQSFKNTISDTNINIKKWFWHKIISEATDPAFIVGAYLELAKLEKINYERACKFYQKFQQELFDLDSVSLESLGYNDEFSFDRPNELIETFIEHIKCCLKIMNDDKMDSITFVNIIQTYDNFLMREDRNIRSKQIQRDYFVAASYYLAVNSFQNRPPNYLKLAKNKLNLLITNDSLPSEYHPLFEFYLGRYSNLLNNNDSALICFNNLIDHNLPNARQSEALGIFSLQDTPATEAFREWHTLLNRNPEKRELVIKKLAKQYLDAPEAQKGISIQEKLTSLATDYIDNAKCNSTIQLNIKQSHKVGQKKPGDIETFNNFLYITEPNRDFIHVIKFDDIIKKFNNYNLYNINFPTGLVNNKSLNKLYVCSLNKIYYLENSLFKLDTTLKLNSYVDIDEFGGSLYIIDCDSAIIFHKSSGFINQIKTQQLEMPRSIAIHNTSKKMFIADYGTQKIHIKLLDSLENDIGSFKRSPQWWPISLEIESDCLYVLFWNLYNSTNDIVQFKIDNDKLTPQKIYNINHKVPIRLFKIKSDHQFYAIENRLDWQIHLLEGFPNMVK